MKFDLGLVCFIVQDLVAAAGFRVWLFYYAPSLSLLLDLGFSRCAVQDLPAATGFRGGLATYF